MEQHRDYKLQNELYYVILRLVQLRDLYKKDGKSRFSLVANQDIINKKKLFPDMSDSLLNQSYLTFPDGYSIIVTSKMLGTPLKERVAGPDLMNLVVKKHPDYGHFFLGAGDGVPQKMISNFKSSPTTTWESITGFFTSENGSLDMPFSVMYS